MTELELQIELQQKPLEERQRLAFIILSGLDRIEAEEVFQEWVEFAHRKNVICKRGYDKIKRYLEVLDRL